VSNNDRALYVISVAAELAGMHPQTLRIYERRGLVQPARTQGGNRRYSDIDIERLRRISELAAEGMNLEGIRRVMALALTLLALGVCATTLITTPWHLILIWGVVVGSGAGMTAYSLSATVVSRWFHRSQGTVVGLLTASSTRS